LSSQDNMSEFQPDNTRPPVDNSASLGRRFGAFLLDGLFLMTAMMFLMQYLGLTDLDPETVKSHEQMQAALLAKITALSAGQKTLLMTFPFVAFFVLHGYLLSRYGQTLGKRILGIAIVTMDNRVPEFFPLITQRYLTQWLAGMLPVIGLLLRLIDILAIFRSDRRCIHDHLAKTKVIDLRIPVAHTHSSSAASGSSLIV
jgi:uncharacterized RDD family membrane protein YckC